MYIEKIKELSQIKNDIIEAKMWELVKLESRWVENQLVLNPDFALEKYIFKNPEVSELILRYAQVEKKLKSILTKKH